MRWDATGKLGGMKCSPTAWEEYQRFAGAVRDAAPQGFGSARLTAGFGGRQARDFAQRTCRIRLRLAAQGPCSNNSNGLDRAESAQISARVAAWQILLQN